MDISNKIENFRETVNPEFIKIAQELRPELSETIAGATPALSGAMGRGDMFTADFGDHHVGYLRFHIQSVGSPPDAPCKLRLRFAEMPFEFSDDWYAYNGKVSSSWLQEEILYADVLPADITVSRRHAFRYVEFLVFDTSPKYKIILSDINCRSVSSGDYSKVEQVLIEDKLLARIDQISLRTMHQCMQSVFEDGPKRDRRLWTADLRLQALVNYVTFKNNSLVKRCLYLLAGATQNEGQVGACMFTEPEPRVDDTALFDSSLLFVSLLHDYYFETGDIETLKDLFLTAEKQLSLAAKRTDEKGIVRDCDGWWCFLDWGDGLNKQAGAHALFIYALKQGARLARALSLSVADDMEKLAESLSCAAVKYLWDGDRKLFVSGDKKQISWVSQIWFVLAGVLSPEENVGLLLRIENTPDAVKMVTPYMYHYYVEALLQCGMTDRAVKCIKSYWGAMAKDGADTFFEVYDPDDPEISPYGARVINSYCHAWSSTPSYFIRKYLNTRQTDI